MNANHRPGPVSRRRSATRPAWSPVALLGLLLALVLTSPAATAAEAAPQPEPAKARPVLKKLSPATGPVAGGTTVTIKGAHLTGATKVLFGKAKGTGLKVKNDRKLTVVAPAGVAGAVTVRVVTKAGKSKAGKLRFTYAATTTAPPGAPIVPPPAALDGFAAAVDCGGVGACFAVGSRQQGATHVPMAYRLAAGSWAVSPLPSLPGTPAAEPDAELEDVACPSPTFCAAVGRYLTAAERVRSLLLTWDGTAWTATSALPPGLPADAETALVALDCYSATSCVAIGGVSSNSTPAVNGPLATTWDGSTSTWSAETLPHPVGTSSAVVDIDCPAADSCIAVGRHEPVGFPFQPFVESLSGGTWTPSQPTLPGDTESGTLGGVACQAADSCTAVGIVTRTSDKSRVGLAARLASGSWTSVATGPPTDSYAQSVMSFADVTCPSAGTCWAVGSYLATRPATPFGFAQEALITRISGTAASMTFDTRGVSAPAGAAANPVGVLRRIVCSAASACSAAGSYIADGLGYRPLVVRVSGEPQPATSPAVPTGTSDAELVGLALDSSGSAVGVGYASAATSKALLLTGLQVGPEVF